MRLHPQVGTRHLGVALTAAMAVSLVAAGSAAASPSYGYGRGSNAQKATAAASVANNTLTITGTNGPDQITIGLSGADPNTLTVDSDGAPQQTFDRTTFNAIAVSLGGGDDQFTEAANPGFPDEPLTVDAGSGDDSVVTGSANDLIFGGSGNDRITSGSGDDIIDAGSGDDSVIGGVGHDTAFLGSGRDDFVWNPGDGSDVVQGDSGSDTLVFNGSPGAEVMSLSPNGHRSLFLRDPGAIRMDMDSVEALNLAPLGGADAITVNDMTGTDFRQANIDLSTAGTGDGQVDNVTVNGTPNADRVRVEADSGRVDVERLQTETRISGSEPTDHLQVNTLDGNDRVNVDAAASPLIGVGVDLGPGQL